MRGLCRSDAGKGVGRLLFVALAVGWASPAVAQEFETPPKVRAADVLPAEMLEGPDHEVDDVVSNGVALEFAIRSTFGGFVAPSREPSCASQGGRRDRPPEGAGAG